MFSNLCLVERDIFGGECAKFAAISFVSECSWTANERLWHSKRWKKKLARVQEVKTQTDRDRGIEMECTKAHELTVWMHVACSCGWLTVLQKFSNEPQIPLKT